MPKLTPGGHALGYLPDIKDQRDFLYVPQLAVETLPSSVDLTNFCSPVEDQGKLGSCTANALVGNLELLEVKSGQAYTDLSRLFVYYNERVIEHSTAYDSGAFLRDGIKTLAKQGACAEKKWPYNIQKFTKKPVKTCYADGLNHRITVYNRLLNLIDMKTCLADGYPFVFGFTVYESFESPEVATTGIVSMPDPSEKVLGGHAVLAIGYDDSTSRFLVRNSWGIDWGLKGYFTIPYDYLSNPNLASDFWTIKQ